MSVMEPRKQEEVHFHDERELDRSTLSATDFEKKYPNKRFYAITRRSDEAVADWFRDRARGMTALDYCCGLGQRTIELARHGALVYGIDISREELRTARAAAAQAGIGHRTRFLAMDAEKLAFRGDSFDLIICSGVLHHLDVNLAFHELARVIKPSGEILCHEALRYNPIIQAYRRLTPRLRTSWEADHILTLKEVKLARRYFGRVEVRYFHLFSILAVPFRRSALFGPILRFCEALDRVVLRLPLIQLMAWQMLFVLSQPKPDAGLAD